MHRFIANHAWLFPVPTSNALMDIFREIPLEIQPLYDFDDEVVWTLEEDGNFTLKSAYCMVRPGPVQPLQWPSFIWFTGCIKKHSICAWMFFLGKLKTKDFLLQNNVDCDSCYVFCPCTWESGSHLMLQCPYSQMV